MEVFKFRHLKAELEKDDTYEIHIIDGIEVYKTRFIDRNKKVTGRCEPMGLYRSVDSITLNEIKSSLIDIMILEKDIEFGGIISIGENRYKVYLDSIDNTKSITLRRFNKRKLYVNKCKK